MLDLEELLEFAKHNMLNRLLADGIHGVKHWERTAKIADMIWYKLSWEKPKRSRRIIQMAAVFHDIGRENDGADPDHGSMGEDWSGFIITGDLRRQFKKGELAAAGYIIGLHCDPSPGTSLEMKVVKDADKCDRFRLSEEGPDPSRLALDVTMELLPEIKKFVLANL